MKKQSKKCRRITLLQIRESNQWRLKYEIKRKYSNNFVFIKEDKSRIGDARIIIAIIIIAIVAIITIIIAIVAIITIIIAIIIIIIALLWHDTPAKTMCAF